MPRREPDKVLNDIARKGGSHLPCPKRKNRAMVSTLVCQNTCRFARRCPVFQAWRNPGLGI